MDNVDVVESVAGMQEGGDEQVAERGTFQLHSSSSLQLLHAHLAGVQQACSAQ